MIKVVSLSPCTTKHKQLQRHPNYSKTYLLMDKPQALLDSASLEQLKQHFKYKQCPKRVMETLASSQQRHMLQEICHSVWIDQYSLKCLTRKMEYGFRKHDLQKALTKYMSQKGHTIWHQLKLHFKLIIPSAWCQRTVSSLKWHAHTAMRAGLEDTSPLLAVLDH